MGTVESASTVEATTADSAASTSASLETTTTTKLVDPPTLEQRDTSVVAVGDPEEVGAGVYLVDASTPVNRSPGVFVFPDGRVRLVYMVGGYDPVLIEVVADTSVRMATCVDVSCSSVEVVELLNLSPYVGMVNGWGRSSFETWVAFTEEGVPYWTWTGWTPLLEATDPEFDQKSQIAACVDVDCGQVIAADMVHEYTVEGVLVEDISQISLATRPDGGIGFAYQYETPAGSSIHYAECDQTLTCSLVEASSTLVTLVSNQTTATVNLGYSNETLPVVSYAPPDQGLWVADCVDAQCHSEPSLHQLTESDASQWPGRVLASDTGTHFTYQGVDQNGHIGIVWCPQADCENSTDTTLKSYQAGFAPFDAILDTGRLQLAWTTPEGLELATCQDNPCTEPDVTATGVPAQGTRLALTDNHTLIIGIINQQGTHLINCDEANC